MKYGRASQIVNAASNLIAPQKISPTLATKEEFKEYNDTIDDMLWRKKQGFYELSYELYEDMPEDTPLSFNDQKRHMEQSQKLFQKLMDGIKNGQIKKFEKKTHSHG